MNLLGCQGLDVNCYMAGPSNSARCDIWEVPQVQGWTVVSYVTCLDLHDVHYQGSFLTHNRIQVIKPIYPPKHSKFWFDSQIRVGAGCVEGRVLLQPGYFLGRAKEEQPKKHHRMATT